MTANYVLLEKVTVGASVSSVTFNNIPQTGYTDLVLKVSGRSNNAQIYSNFTATFNGVSSGYSFLRMSGNGSSASSDGPFTSQSLFYIGEQDGANATANTFSNTEFYIPNYTSSNYKSISIDKSMENNATTAYSGFHAALWSNTAAITSISITSDATIQQYSTFSLYGIAAVGTTPTKAPFAAGGDIIQTDGTYWYHAFLSSGTFTPAKTLSCDVLVVAGGGAGGAPYSGYSDGGGGGAGGVLGFASQTLNLSTSYICTIGAGGIGSAGSTGTSGNNSSFASLTASVGGGYGGYGQLVNTAGSGGSGGGGMSGAGQAGIGGSGTTNQGNTGANGIGGSPYAGGGGGGAGSTPSTGGSGGAGVNTYTNATWLSTALTALSLGVGGYIAGGGAGGTTASSPTTATAGGGNGGYNGSSTGSAGTANTGGGGGGGGNAANVPGGNGGSGITIIRYLA
jgi:hypothetical protein